MNILVSIVAILASSIGIVFSIRKYFHSSFSNHAEKYRFLKEMHTDFLGHENNRALIQYGLQAFSKRWLTIEDSLWFLKTGRAFQYLRQYGNAQRYLVIDKIKNKFIYNENFSTKKARWLDFIGIGSGYTFFGSLGLFILLSSVGWAKTHGIKTLVVSLPISIYLLGVASLFVFALIGIRDARALEKLQAFEATS